MSGKRLYYWDSCVLLAWIQDEKRENPADMAGVARVAEAYERGDVRLTTSVIADIEVLPSDFTDEQRDKYTKVFRPGGFDQQGITSPIVALARKIRDTTKQQNITISTPDAIHLATAMTVNVDAFHTFDGTGTGKKKRKLLPLSGNAIVEGMLVCVPDHKSPPPKTAQGLGAQLPLEMPEAAPSGEASTPPAVPQHDAPIQPVTAPAAGPQAASPPSPPAPPTPVESAAASTPEQKLP
jgi:hypothetical protein